MLPRLARLSRHLLAVLIAVTLTLLAVRACDSQRLPPLKPWHVLVPGELTERQIDATDWAGWLAHEEALRAEVEAALRRKVGEADLHPANRYWLDGPLYSGSAEPDWNRSYLLAPEGTPRGAVVLVHGLTDGPYSLRHVATQYRQRGFLAVGLRLPGHGTVPAALTATAWQDWLAAVRLAMRTARDLVAEGAPLHLVGYSNGGALALLYTLDAAESELLPRPDRLVLFSPMLGISGFARFAGVYGWPAVFPAFARAAWIDVAPEYNPYKYNSFPVHAAREASRLSRHLRARLQAAERGAGPGPLPPILCFQSVADATVSARAVIDELYARLPANGSELVLFDFNHAAEIGPLLVPEATSRLNTLLPASPRAFAVRLYSNRDSADGGVLERFTAAGSSTESVTDPGLRFPAGVWSLSHIAVHMPEHDPLYGRSPGDDGDLGLHLGAMAWRGERGWLLVGADSLARVSSNPFYERVAARLDRWIDGPEARQP